MRASVVFPAALLMASPALYAAFTGAMDPSAALQRLLLALVVAMVGNALVVRVLALGAGPSAAKDGSGPGEGSEVPLRRRTDPERRARR